MSRHTFGPFVLDPQRGILLRDGRPVAVGNKGLILLRTLLASRGHNVGKAELLDAAWPGMAVEESNLSVQIAALRKILGAAPDGSAWIATIPRGGYRFVDGGDSFPEPAPPPAQRPSIIVLPFINASGDPQQDYLADGITEDVIIALTRFRWFSVIARNTSFFYKGKPVDVKSVAQDLGVRYLIEGGLRKSGSHIRITAQLIDAASGNHIWADRYDLEFTEVFAIQDEIAERVAGAIEPELLKTESALAAARHTGNMTAWDLVRQGTFHFHQVRRETHYRARELFRDAARLDPDLPEAHIWLARVSAGIVPYGWSENPESDLAEGLRAALRAIQLDDRNPYSHYGLAIVGVFSGALEKAMRAAERAVEISPSFALGHLVLGMARLFAGRAIEAVTPLEYGLRLSPYDPQNFVWYNILALSHLFAGQPSKARDVAEKALQVRPAWRTTLETLVACHAALNEWNRARDYRHEIQKGEPMPGDVLAPMRQRNPVWAAQLADSLRQAESLGIPPAIV